jgi:serine/threonine-protein kinase ATR
LISFLFAQPKETAYTETSDMQSARSYIRSWVGQQPHYQWMTVLPQLLSRVTHSDDRVFEFITTIIGKVFQSYPDHAVWSVLPLKRFRRTEVKIRQLLELVIKESPLGVNEATLQMRFNQEFVDNVLTLCHELPPATINAKQPSYKMQKKNGKLLLALERLRVGSPTNPNIRAPIVPLQSFFTVNLPTNGLPDPNFTGFSEQIVRFDSFNENIEVLKSKERPKKIAVVGTDGRQYNFLCKREQRGDMRKDSRLMEFATVMNRLFRTDPQARRRPKLNFRTYSVFPMTEECGLIEWVPQTRPFRHILTDLYSSIGVEFDFKLIRSMFEATLGPDKKTRILSAEINMLEQLNKMFSPVFSRWFVQTFPDPGAWLEARSAFTVSTASWSIMGAMVGLGDRHGENLLINLDTGSLVQVDFDCLFDKGEELAAPERVPFRLTPNMIDAFGVLGIEGTYRRACEVTMSVIHQNRDLLYNVLQAFINDPLVEWEKSPQPSLMGPKQPAAAPDPNALKALQEYALVHLQKIDRRLRGMIGKDTAPVSVRRQVDYLINEATSKANLARMFIGWMSWL